MEVYVFDVAQLRGREDEALATLGGERRDKALRLQTEGPRLRSMAAGLLLRRFVGDGPLFYGPQGKPFLPEGPWFSLSHSGGYALLALDAESVGADIEPMKARQPALLRRVLTEDEQRWCRQDEARRFAFLWTRKEAVLKWDGCGIAYPLRELSVLPGERPRVNGKSCELCSVEYNGYMISAAGSKPQFVPQRATWEELMT